MTKFQRFMTKVIAIIEIMSARTFSLESSTNKPSDFEHVTHGSYIREEDYIKK